VKFCFLSSKINIIFLIEIQAAAETLSLDSDRLSCLKLQTTYSNKTEKGISQSPKSNKKYNIPIIPLKDHLNS
jgi:hypothetical protein